MQSVTLAAAPTGPYPAQPTQRPPWVRWTKHAVGIVVFGFAIWWLTRVVNTGDLGSTARALITAPLAMVAALGAYSTAFAIRAVAWQWLQPTISYGQAWAAIHVSLLGNHVLPLRLGEALRVTSAVRRAGVPWRETTGVTIALRLGDLLALLVIAAVTAPLALGAIVGPWLATALAATLTLGIIAAWRALVGADAQRQRVPPVRLAGVVFAVTTAWVLEAAVLFAVARSVGFELQGATLSVAEAAGVTAVTIFAQVLAVTPGGFGTYEAAGTAAFVGLGADASAAFAVVLLTHAVKTVYSLFVGGVALVAPAPGYWGRWRLPRHLPDPPTQATNQTGPIRETAPVVVFLPAHNEADAIAQVLDRIPSTVHTHPVHVVVVDDGSTEDSAALAAAAGAHVIQHPTNRGLGAAVRTGIAWAVAQDPAAGVYLDADAEYQPEDIAAVVEPILRGQADYVVGSRFTGNIEHMRPHRRFGNEVLTRWVRWMTRRQDLTDGQSGFRAFSSTALVNAEIIHDYNYAQVLTLSLLAQGFRYTEVPITYAFRTSGASFIKLGTYLRRVVPAVHRQLNAERPTSSLIFDDVRAK